MGKKKRGNKFAQASLAMRLRKQDKKLTEEIINERIIAVGPVSQEGFDRAYRTLTKPGSPLLNNYAGVVEDGEGNVSFGLVPVSDVEKSGVDGKTFFQRIADRANQRGKV